jgi:tRNA pseudouridine38-40 synthase
LIGEHDFASFTGSGQGLPARGQGRLKTRRRLDRLTIEIVEETAQGRLIQLQLEARSFLPQMVRNITGALVAVGSGRWPVERIAEVLAAADRRQSAPTAPAEGVILLAVEYDELTTSAVVASEGGWAADEGEDGSDDHREDLEPEGE